MLGKRFEQQRPAIAMSVAIGYALSIGLVWWERANRFSIKKLGPIAVGFAILLLAFIMYQSVRTVGGSWAGAGIAIGLAIIIAHVLGFPVPVAAEILQTLIVVALIVGLMAFVSHRHQLQPRARPPGPELPDIKKTMADLYRQRHLSKNLDHGLRKSRKEARTLHEHPEETSDILRQIQRMLPAQGYLTGRMAALRAKAHQVRNGQVARLEETRHTFTALPTSAKKRASAELVAKYNQMVGIEARLERLDRAVAENEKHIRQLTAKTQEYTAKYDHQQLYQSLTAAEKLPHHNSKLIKIIERTEHKLSAIAREVAKEVKHIERNPNELEDLLGELDPPYETKDELKVGRMLDRYGIPFFCRPATIIYNEGTNEIWKPSLTMYSYGGAVIDYIAGEHQQQQRLSRDKIYRYNQIPAVVLGPKDRPRR